MKLRKDYTCPLELVHDMIRGKWKSVIMWRLSEGPASPSQLEKDIAGITQKMLTEHLKELVDCDIVAKKTYDGYPLKVEYSLTLGKGVPLLEAMRIMRRVGTEGFGDTKRPLELVRDQIRGKWKSIILWRLRNGGYSLSGMEKSINGITQKMLLEQVKELVDCGLVDKKTYDGYPLKVEYSLSVNKGAPLLEAMRIMQRVGIATFMENGLEHVIIEQGISAD